MEELLKKLLEANILSESNRQELSEALNKQLSEAIATARKEATIAVTAELNEQWINDREVLVEALDAKVTELLTAELQEYHESIDQYRDVEAEFAEKLVEAKAQMAESYKADLTQLVEHLNSFLEERLTVELEQFRDNINEVQKISFGRKVFESFVEEFKKHYAGDDSLEGKLNETEQRLEDTESALQESETKLARLQRSIKLNEVLSPLSGRTKEVMSAILDRVETAQLEEAYKTYIGRVLRESSKEDQTSEKEKSTVLAEGNTTKTEVSGVTKTGDDAQQISESAVHTQVVATTPTISDAEKTRLRRLAGITN